MCACERWRRANGNQAFHTVCVVCLLLASTDVTLWRQLVLPLLDLFLPSYIVRYRMFSLVICSRWSILFSSCVMFFSFWSLRISSLFVWPLVVFLSCLSCLSDCISCCCCFTIFDGLLLISSKYIRDPRPDITWSSYGRPLLCDSLLRVDLDPSDRVIQPASFTTAGAIDHIPSESLTSSFSFLSSSASLFRIFAQSGQWKTLTCRISRGRNSYKSNLFDCEILSTVSLLFINTEKETTPSLSVSLSLS